MVLEIFAIALYAVPKYDDVNSTLFANLYR
jgi:hypothetical protein